MAGIADYSTTASSNTAVGGVSIAEGMAPGNVNNAIRALMADLATFYGTAFYRSNVLGTVSGNSSVTGSIIERGSNSNGRYVRFADGTQICMGQVTVPFSGASSCAATITWPATYSSPPDFVVGSVVGETSTDAGTTAADDATPGPDQLMAPIIAPRTTSSATIRIYRQNGGTNFVSGDDLYAVYFSFGRWYG